MQMEHAWGERTTAGGEGVEPDGGGVSHRVCARDVRGASGAEGGGGGGGIRGGEGEVWRAGPESQTGGAVLEGEGGEDGEPSGDLPGSGCGEDGGSGEGGGRVCAVGCWGSGGGAAGDGGG